MDTSNHSWNAGDRPSLRVTPAGLSLLAYLDYVTVHNFVSLAPGDTRVPPDPPSPVAPPERLDEERQPRMTPWEDVPEQPLEDMDDDDDDYGDHSPEENYNSGYTSDDPGARGDLDPAGYWDDEDPWIDPASDVDDGED